MIRSMTGFGHAELKTPHGLIRAEVKTINHKFFELSARLPLHLTDLEDPLRRLAAQRIRRGKAVLVINSPDPSVVGAKLHLNEPLAREVHAKLRRLARVLGVEERGGELRTVFMYPDVLTREVTSSGRAELARQVERTVARALDSLESSRRFEGRALKRDVERRAAEIRSALRIIERRIPVLARDYRASLEKRMKDLLKDAQIDRERLTLEVAQYVKSSDISEEVTRLRSHLEALAQALKTGGELGRKIDFIGQEMTREANTMGAKSSDRAIADAVIDIKSAIEKIREQAQNVE
ncbi:MAG: hypothetical protein MOGMAGMI_02271 [Candidatus Omnitrophica bacterium]|nr:hypothetical protein [Candidatus Omnitrophota bacterium]